MKNVPLFLFLVLCAVCVGHALASHAQLPDVVDSRFDLGGNPVDNTSKNVLVGVYLAVVGLMLASFVGLRQAIPRFPDWAWNLRKKTYWLSPEQRPLTVAFMQRYMMWLGVATMLLLLDTFQQGLRVNLGDVPAMTHLKLSLGLYLGFVALWLVNLWRRFSTPNALNSGAREVR